MAYSDQDRANTFAHHLENTFQPNNIESDIEPIIKINKGAPIRLVTPKEILKVIFKLRAKKAPGFDLITARMLKEAPKKLRVYLTYLFNAILRMNHQNTILRKMVRVPWYF